MTRSLLLATALLVLVAGVAAAAGPSPGTADALTVGGTRYAAAASGGSTSLSVPGHSVKLAGAWGFPMVTFTGQVEGVSHDRRTLVLERPLGQEGQIASPSRFALLDARTLRLRKIVSVPGRFSYDALSPDGARLYLIEHVTVLGTLRYRVRLYDIRSGRLARRAIADERSHWTTMEGAPVARATSDDGGWVYTLYGGVATPFVHALNARAGSAVCIDLPAGISVDSAVLRLRGSRLIVQGRAGDQRAAVDRRTLRVVENA
jgi:hypothetical protein